MEEVHGCSSLFLHGGARARLAVSIGDIAAADRAPVALAAGTAHTPSFPHRRVRARLTVSRGDVAAADRAAMVPA